MVALRHHDLAHVGEAEHPVRRRVVELGGVDQVAVERGDDLAAGEDDDRGAHRLEEVGREADGAVFHALELVGVGDRRFEPAERLGRHGAVEERLDVELEDLLDQFVVELLAAAVVDPAEEHLRVEAERRAGAEEAGVDALAEPVGGDAVAAVERARMDGVHQAERGDDRAGGQDVDLQPPARHLLDLFAPGDEDIVENVLRRPGGLHLERDGLLRRSAPGPGQTDQRRAARGESGLQHLAPRDLFLLVWNHGMSPLSIWAGSRDQRLYISSRFPSILYLPLFDPLNYLG